MKMVQENMQKVMAKAQASGGPGGGGGFPQMGF